MSSLNHTILDKLQYKINLLPSSIKSNPLNGPNMLFLEWQHLEESKISHFYGEGLCYLQEERQPPVDTK